MADLLGITLLIVVLWAAIYLMAHLLEPALALWIRIRCALAYHRDVVVHHDGMLHYRCVECKRLRLLAGVIGYGFTGMPVGLQRKRRRAS